MRARRGRSRWSVPGRLALAAAAVAIATSAPTAWAAAGPDGGPVRAAVAARARVLMGTRLTIEVQGAPPEAAFEAAFGEVARLEQILSNWRATSEITRLNEAASRGPVLCSTDLFAAIGAALRWAEATDGAFDPTVEPIVRRLGLRQSGAYLPPGPEGLPGALRPTGDDSGGPQEWVPIGWRHVLLDEAARTVRFSSPGVGIDLGGIGKGIALDAAARVLERRGVRSALLDFGGQVLAVGSPPGEPGWTIGISDPEDRRRGVAAVRASNLSLSTSGNGEGRAEGPPGQPGHIIDASRGEPAAFGGSVTVAVPDATSADALSTALFVMGPEKGAAWAESRRIAALYLWREPDGSLGRRCTSFFERILEEGRPGPERESGESAARLLH